MNAPSSRLVAHRGYMELFPENSWRGIQAAISAGAVWIEFDIQMHRSGRFYLLHDADFQRTASAPVSLFDLPDAQLGGLSIHEPARLGETYHPEPLCSLDEALARIARSPQVRAMVEIKEESIEHWGLVPVMQTLLPVLEPFKSQCVLISFSIEALRYARDHSDLPIGWVLREYAPPSLIQARDLNPHYLICNYTKLPATEPPASGPWRWMLYDITDPAEALEWMGRGIELIETRDIGNLVSLLCKED